MVVEAIVMALSFSPQGARIRSPRNEDMKPGVTAAGFSGSIEPDIADLGWHRVAMSPKHRRIPPALPRLCPKR
jgi:hypothetical protein